MHRLLALATTIVFFVHATVAQVPPPPGVPPVGDKPADGEKGPKKKVENKAGKKKVEEEKAAAAASSTDDIVPLPGDTVFFKNGSTLKGVTVTRESPSGIEVKVTDADTLVIPRKQIDHIDYKKAEAAPEAAANAPGADINILKGQKVSGELYTKLTTALPDDALEVKETDYVKVLGDLATKLGVTIEIADSVKKLPVKNRIWSVKLDKGSNLSNLLENGLLANFANLQLDFPQDKIVLSIKDAAPAPAPAPKPAQ